MRKLAIHGSILAHTLLIAGCAMHVPVKAPVPPDALESAKSMAAAIEADFPAYLADPVSRYEQPEILNVERDIVSISDETDDALFVEEVNLLKKDWGILVALDNVIGRESVI